MVLLQNDVDLSHNFIVLSLEQDTVISVSLILKINEIECSCPINVFEQKNSLKSFKFVLLALFHILIVISEEPLTKTSLSQATLLTEWVWPFKILIYSFSS